MKTFDLLAKKKKYFELKKETILELVLGNFTDNFNLNNSYLERLEKLSEKNRLELVNDYVFRYVKKMFVSSLISVDSLSFNVILKKNKTKYIINSINVFFDNIYMETIRFD